MAFRFRKSVKIAPGIKVNFSSSGTSWTVGPKGYTTTYSKRGKYRNVSIPGTGLSTRYKAGGTKKRTTRAQTTASAHGASKRQNIPAAVKEWIAYTGEREPKASVGMELDGTIVLVDRNGDRITDPQLISIIKRTPIYKDQLPHLKELHRVEVAEKVEEVNAESETLIKICRLSPSVMPPRYYQEQLDAVRLEHYEPVPFGKQMPTEVDVQIAVSEEADRNVKGMPWNLRKLKEAYFSEHYQQRYAEMIEAWRSEKDAFELSETQKAEQLNRQYLATYEEMTSAFRDAIEGSTEYIECAAEDWIGNCEIPLEVFTQFEYKADVHCLMVDLDLPEIEDLPTTMATQLASGHLRMKNKTQKQLREEYAECVFGLAVFVASNLFNTSPRIESIIISGYTQRRNKYGEIADDYIYSIRFVRDAFYGVNYKTMNPETFCMQFDNRCNVSATKLFKAIVPY